MGKEKKLCQKCTEKYDKDCKDKRTAKCGLKAAKKEAKRLKEEAERLEARIEEIDSELDGEAATDYKKAAELEEEKSAALMVMSLGRPSTRFLPLTTMVFSFS